MSNGIDGFDTSAFMDEFVQEVAERLQAINAGLLQLEQQPENMEVLHDVFRAAHSIKGAAKIMGREKIARVAHAMEDVLEVLDRRADVMTPAVNDLLLRGVDAIETLTAAAEKGETADLSVDDLCQALIDAAAGRLPAESRAAGESLPSSTAAPPEQLPPTESAGAPVSLSPAVDTVRINVAQLERLVTISTELIMTRMRSHRYLEEFADLADQLRKLNREFNASAHRATSEGERDKTSTHVSAQLVDLHRHVSELELSYEQYLDSIGDLTEQLKVQALSMRLLPLSTLFSGLPRAVRDLARRHQKEVRLTLEGGETSLDKAIINGLGSTLVHLLRNAVDHGIESPAERRARGKPATGHIRIAAKPEGDQVVLTVEDDGRGLDPHLMRETAVQKGLVQQAEAETMSDIQAVNLIFRDGFSTRREVTDTSGRGVGMSAVREQVEQMRGTMQVHSTPGRGTQFELIFPLSLSTLHALLVESAGQTWAVPATSVAATMMVPSSMVCTVDGRLALHIRGHAIPVAPLDGLLGSPASAWPTDGECSPVILFGSPDIVAIGVDRLVDEQEIVSKPLGPFLAGLPKVTGATILGDGRVVVILNPSKLVEEVQQWRAESQA